jgi:hypothetical protein
MRISKCLFGLLPVIFLALPFSASAATLQQIYLKSIDATFKKGAPLRVDAKLKALVNDTVSGKTSKSEMDARLMLRYRQERGGMQDSEGRFVLEKLKTQNPDGVLPNSIDSPLAIEWKHLGQTSYFRLKTGDLPGDLETQLGPDIAKLLGQWLYLESTEARKTTQDFGSELRTSVPEAAVPFFSDAGFFSEFKKLQVVGIEKTERRPNRDLVYRLRLRVNLAELAKEEKTKMAELAKMTDAAAKKNAQEVAKKSFAKQREEAKHTWFAATVNVTQNTLERLEVSGWTIEESSSDQGKAKKRTDINLGMSFWKNGDWDIEKPANPLDIKEIMTNLMSQMIREPEPKTEDGTAPQAASVGLVDEWIETIAGYKVRYSDKWLSRFEGGVLSLTADFEEDGIMPKMEVWPYERYLVWDEDRMFDEIIKQVRDKLLLDSVERDGWVYTLLAPEPTVTSNTMDRLVAGKYFLMTRNTDAGVIVTRISIYPSETGGKYLAVLFHEPLVPTQRLERLRDMMLDSFTILSLP